MYCQIYTAVCEGISGRLVKVETDILHGMPAFSIVGLGGTAVMESKERIKSAVVNSGYSYPRNRITINLAPANLHKNGSHFDLAIAVGILTAGLYIDKKHLNRYAMIGELSLEGAVTRVDGILPMVMCLKEKKIQYVIVPYENYEEAELIDGIAIMPVSTLAECVYIINENKGTNSKIAINNVEKSQNANRKESAKSLDLLDFSDVYGQDNAKRAVTIAVAGNHGLIMMGNPGCGKSMLAKRIPTVMPEMSKQEIIETTMIYSVTGKLNDGSSIICRRPFREPYHTIGNAGFFGGGIYPVPGEITLAHNGVLFMDEICEFSTKTIEKLRVPLEEKKITHFRKGKAYSFPCNCLPIFASNPCKCGYYGDDEHECKCSIREIEKYRSKLSGPLLDRIDLHIQLNKVNYSELSEQGIKPKSSADMEIEINEARQFSKKRTGKQMNNGDMTDKQVKEYCQLGKEEKEFFKQAYERLGLTPRTYMKCLKVSRTIADLDKSKIITVSHIAEALRYRVLSGMYLKEGSL